jgi:putative membrane protein
VVFSILGYALRLGGGPVGIAVFVLFLLVQIAALSNVVPLETAPAPLQRLNSLLPLTAYADAVNRLVAGGEVGSTVGPVVVLVGWGLAAVVAVSVIVKRMRVASSPRGVPTPTRAAGGHTNWSL